LSIFVVSSWSLDYSTPSVCICKFWSYSPRLFATSTLRITRIWLWIRSQSALSTRKSSVTSISAFWKDWHKAVSSLPYLRPLVRAGQMASEVSIAYFKHRSAVANKPSASPAASMVGRSVDGRVVIYQEWERWVLRELGRYLWKWRGLGRDARNSWWRFCGPRCIRSRRAVRLNLGIGRGAVVW
jgi:hypothetical protein